MSKKFVQDISKIARRSGISYTINKIVDILEDQKLKPGWHDKYMLLVDTCLALIDEGELVNEDAVNTTTGRDAS